MPTRFSSINPKTTEAMKLNSMTLHHTAAAIFLAMAAGLATPDLATLDVEALGDEMPDTVVPDAVTLDAADQAADLAIG